MGRNAALQREAELAELRRRVAAGCAGRGGLLVVEGPAGIGKTTLLEAATRIARGQGAMALSARGAPLEHDFSFGVVRELFEPARATLGADRWARIATGAASLAVPVLTATTAGPGSRRSGMPCTRPCTGCTGCWPTWPSSVRCCSRSTTFSGSIRPRRAGWPTWAGG